MHIGFLEVVLMLIVILVTVGPIWVVYRWVMYLRRNNNKPLDIARERYAKGEINKADFEDIKKSV